MLLGNSDVLMIDVSSIGILRLSIYWWELTNLEAPVLGGSQSVR